MLIYQMAWLVLSSMLHRQQLLLFHCRQICQRGCLPYWRRVDKKVNRLEF